MKTVQLESEVRADGVLALEIPLGPEEAQRRVLVTIQPLPGEVTNPPASDWHAFVAETYGSGVGLGLEEPQDLPLQEREWPQ